MADETATETVAQVPPEQPKAEPEEVFDAERAMATIKNLREFEKKAKALEKKVQEFEQAEQKRKEAELSEMERLQKQLDEAKQKAAALERENAQRKAADDAGLPLAFADRIKGETPEAMLADAQALLEAMPKASAPPKIKPTNVGGNAQQVTESDAERRKRLFG